MSIARHVFDHGGTEALPAPRARQDGPRTLKNTCNIFGGSVTFVICPPPRCHSPVSPPDISRRIRERFDALPPEVQRAARWLADHPSEVALLSMRQQARSAGVSAPTMVRLARALGFADYASLRRPFQEAMAGRSLSSSAGARRRCSRRPPRRASGGSRAKSASAQIDDVQSVQALNPAAQIEAVVARSPRHAASASSACARASASPSSSATRTT